jgi:ABC-type antimicrobial peptide transport system permease subunit
LYRLELQGFIAAAGLFGVMAYAVEQRTSELGLRLALGATPSGIILMVLKRAVAVIAVGLAVGIVMAWQVTRFAEAFLFEIEPTDPRVFAVAVVVLALAGLVAAAIPARRAGLVAPLESLRHS